MRKQVGLIALLLLLLKNGVTQNISRIEYFINTDPGFGNATSISFSPSGNISNLFFSPDISPLAKGLHHLYIRSQDDAGVWSLTNHWVFVKDVVSGNVTKLEYFIDTDPGFGSGINIAFSPSANVSNLLISPDISSLAKGIHTLFIRSLDDAGKWTLTNRWMFLKEVVPGNLAKLEYFIDTDPGFGNATDVPVAAAANVAGLLIPIDVSALSIGMHSIFLRSRDDAGNWSLTNRWLFLKDLAPANVTKAEFFIDTDPGFGNATDVAVSPALNISNITIPVDVTALSRGMHTIYLRTKDLSGRWSLTNRWLFVKDIAQDNFASGEYFFDTDPGFGNGTTIPFGSPLGTNIADFAFAANLAGLPNGAHYLFVRTREANGKWSLTNVIQFDKNIPLPVKLLFFDVQAEGKKAHLTWRTATEQNSDRFEIERSINGVHFEKIGSVKAAGYSNVHIDYSFYDVTPKKGINYYRLKEVDIDNSVQLSETKTVRFGDDQDFSLYNNPTNGADLKVKTNILPASLLIFDAGGKKIKEINLTTGVYSLSVTDLVSGTYLAVLNKEGKVLAVEKFIVQK